MQHENFDIDGYLSRNLMPDQNDPNYDYDKFYNTNEIQGMYFVQSKLPNTDRMDLRKELESLDIQVRAQFQKEIGIAFENFYKQPDLYYSSKFENFNLKEQNLIEDLKDISTQKLGQQISLSNMNLNFRIWNSLFSLLNNHYFLNDLTDSIDIYIQLKKDIIKYQQETLNLLQDNKNNNKQIFGKFQQKFNYRYGGNFKDFFMGIEFEQVIQHVLFLLYIINHFIEIYQDDDYIYIQFNFKPLKEKKILFKELQKLIEKKLGYSIDNFIQNIENKQFIFEEIEEDYKKNIILLKINKLQIEKVFCYEKQYQKNQTQNLYYEKDAFEIYVIWLFTNCLHSSYISITSVYTYYSKSIMNFIGLQLNLNKKIQQQETGRKLIYIALTFNRKFNSQEDNQLRMYRTFSVQQKLIETQNDLYILCKIFKQDINFDNIQQFCESLKNQLGKTFDIRHLNLEQDLHQDQKKFISKTIEKYFTYNITLYENKIISQYLSSPQNLLIIKQIDQSLLVKSLDENIDKFKLKLKNEKTQNIQNNSNSFQFNKMRQYLFKSQKVNDSIIEFLNGQKEILKKAVCFHNLKNQWDLLNSQIYDILHKDSEKKINQPVHINLRFKRQGDRVKLEKKLDSEVKQMRGFRSEHIISKNSINDIFPYIEQMHWKVQNGLFIWYNVFLERQKQCKDILKCFEKLHIKKIYSRQTSIKYFGAFSKFFKFVKHLESLQGYEKYIAEKVLDNCLLTFLSVDSEIFIDLDAIFGYCETTKEENVEWDKEFVEHLYEWLNRDTKEKLFGLDITFDFKLNLELIMRDQKITNSIFSKLDENKIYLYVEKNYKIDQFNKIFPFQIYYPLQNNVQIEPLDRNYLVTHNTEKLPSYLIQQSFDNIWKFTYKTFKQTTSNYLNYKATGTVQGMKLNTKNTQQFVKLQEKEPELCKKAINALKGKNVYKMNQLQQKSISKTICFSYTGESLIKLLYWVYGKKKYQPLYKLFLKKEPKKIRHVINSDLTSFVKQTYFHDWMKNVLNEKVKQRINSLMDPQQRVLFYKRSQITGPNEKWCVELDLKDFHHHFGKSHYNAISEVLLEKIQQNVSCEQIRKDLRKIISEFKDELCAGRVEFYIRSNEPNLFQKYMDNLDTGNQQKCNCECREIKEGQENYYFYNLIFEISNGLMSGWKLTSMLGSLFNITLNKMCEQWTQMMTQDILYNENVMGDDTHLKKRYLIGSISHINFVNQIGKIAHPQKQMVSTTILEYLKKKINTINKTTEYSNLTSLNTILYRKKKKVPVISKSDVQDSIDLFNLFLARITIQESRYYILNHKYFHKYLQHIANYNNDRFRQEERNIQRLIDSPVLISGAVAGHLRKLQINFQTSDCIEIIDRIVQFETPDKFMVQQIDLQSGQCKGLQSNVNKIVMNLGMQNKIRSAQLRMEVLSSQYNQIIESTADYYMLKTKNQYSDKFNNNEQVNFIDYNIKIRQNKKFKAQNINLSRKKGKNMSDFFDKILDPKELNLFGKQNEYFNVFLFKTLFFEFLEYSIMDNIQFAGLIGELVYCERQVSQSIYRALKDNYKIENNQQSQYYYNQIYQNLSSLKGNTSITPKIRSEFLKHFNNKTFFYFALNDCLQVSVSQKFVHPDLIGYINTEFSKYLIHYLLLNHSRQVTIPVNQLKEVFKKIVMTVDFFINQDHEDIHKKIDAILERKIQSQFQFIQYHEYNFLCYENWEKIYFQNIKNYADFQNQALNGVKVPGVTIVRTEEEAREVLKVLKEYKNRIHAWDTETIDLDIKVQSPVGNGKIICAQAFCGPDVPFKDGPRLFIDNFGESKDLILLFKDYMQNQEYKKVWFNYGFDRHIFYNHGIDCQGFHGDSMQMARLLDSSREPNQYSLSKLSNIYLKEIQQAKSNLINYLTNLDLSEGQKNSLELYQQYCQNQEIKVNMKNLFARKKLLKNGQEGKIFETPSILELHTSHEFIHKWINYGTLDSEMTFFLFYALKSLLKNLPVEFEGLKNMYGIYQKYWRPFGRLLTDIERRGILVDLEHLKNSQIEAEIQSEQLKKDFIKFVQKIQPDCIEFNPLSSQQLQQFLFAPFQRERKKPQKKDQVVKEKDLFYIERNYQEVNDFPDVREFKVEKIPDHDYSKIDDSKRKFRIMKIKGLGIPPVLLSASGLPSVDTNVIKTLTQGKIIEHFKNQNQEEFGKELQENLQKLMLYKKIQTLLQNFIMPLQQLADKNSRIHCSLNINTETGRLSSKNPNLQNQPALDKDVYKTRKAFIAGKNRKLIIADYSQLELRILAHITNCKSMIKAFKEGGDFHSRTALGMFPEIQKEMNEGKILLERSKDNNKQNIPLLKDKFQNERKKAKTMNFSVAYGKTSYGFAKDWNCSLKEAQQFVELWYDDRPEVRDWQEQKKQIAVEKGFTKTLMGRYRILSKHFIDLNKQKMSHGLRAAINTPIQGGAADVVIAAMVKIDEDQWLRDNDWLIIHQVHDEIILEGPEDTANEAKQRIQKLMEHPLNEDLLVSLETDASICDNWMEGK